MTVIIVAVYRSEMDLKVSVKLLEIYSLNEILAWFNAVNLYFVFFSKTTLVAKLAKSLNFLKYHQLDND